MVYYLSSSQHVYWLFLLTGGCRDTYCQLLSRDSQFIIDVDDWWHCYCCWCWLNWITRNFYIFSPCLGQNIRELGSGGTACSWSSCARNLASWCLCFTFGVSKLRFKENLKYCCRSEGIADQVYFAFVHLQVHMVLPLVYPILMSDSSKRKTVIHTLHNKVKPINIWNERTLFEKANFRS